MLRHSTAASAHREGTDDYGCWFYTAVGSGVWINVGRTRLWASRREALRRVDGPSSSFEGETALAKGTAADGLDSCQLLESNAGVFSQNGAPLQELLVTRDECMRGAEPLPSACIPDSVPTRGGVAADLPCECDPDVPVLNCKELAAEP